MKKSAKRDLELVNSCTTLRDTFTYFFTDGKRETEIVFFKKTFVHFFRSTVSISQSFICTWESSHIKNGYQ